MREHAKYECEADIGGRYDVLKQVAASYLNRSIKIGREFHCRYCGRIGQKHFRSVAHLFPEFLGNKRIISVDECDICNQLFQTYDSELAKYLNPFLTMGNVKGKRGTPALKDANIRFERKGENGNIRIHVKDKPFEEHLEYNNENKNLSFKVPLPAINFRPRHAYKALAKMGYGLLPEQELQKFTMLRKWLLVPFDEIEFPFLEVSISYCREQSWKPIPLTQGTLIRRVNPKDEIPHMIFILVAGATCMQIELKSDHMNDHSDWLPVGAVKINWRLILGGDNKNQTPLIFEYSNRRVENWSSQEIQKTEPITMNMNIGFDGDISNALPRELFGKPV